MSTKLDRLTELAKEEPKRQFFSIAHLITPETLYAAFRSLRKDASAGMDGVTYEGYQQDAERKIQELYQIAMFTPIRRTPYHLPASSPAVEFLRREP
jgi:hypothetical protein